MAGLELLASGRDADVYALDGDRVLRRYRTGGDAGAEAVVMGYLAGHGFPVPRVYSVDGPDLVLERIDGPTMVGAFVDGRLDLDGGAGILADLHKRLHAVPARASRDPTDRILHLDLHPENVMLTAGGPVLIDWRDSAEGPPGLDLAVSALILAEVAVDPGIELAASAHALMTAFLRRVGQVAGHLDRALAMRRANPTLRPEEKERLDLAAAVLTRGSPRG